MFEAFGSKVFCYKVSLPEVIPIDPQWQREQTRERGGKRVGGCSEGGGRGGPFGGRWGIKWSVGQMGNAS